MIVNVSIIESKIINVPMDKSTLGIHQVELVIQSCPGFGNRGGV